MTFFVFCILYNKRNIRWFIDFHNLADVTTSGSYISPTFQTPGYNQPIVVRCNWSPWLNADKPSSSPSDLGDLEKIELLKQTYGLCPTITNVACRVASTGAPIELSGQNATCDPLNGLRCYNSEQTTKMCYDYEIRVLCWSAECTGVH